MKAIVLGARGSVGARVVELLRVAGHDVVRVGRARADADVVLDLTASDLSDYRELTAEADVVINASGLERVDLAVSSGAPFVDISATSTYFAALAHTPPRAGALLSVGLAPGLSTLAAAELAANTGDAIDVALVLGEGERHGAAAIGWTIGLLGTRFDDPASGAQVMNLTEPRMMGSAPRRRGYVRADFPDGAVVGPERGVAVRNYLALSSPAATLALRGATRIPRWGARLMSLHLSGSDQWELFVQNRRTGEFVEMRGREQSVVTADVTAVAAELATDAHLANSGGTVRHLHHVTTLVAMAERVGLAVSRGAGVVPGG